MRLRAPISSFWFLFILAFASLFSQLNLEGYGGDHKRMNPHPSDYEYIIPEVSSDNDFTRIEPPRKNARIFDDRRKKLLVQIKEGIALINSSGVSFDPPALCKNLEYLTGLES